MIKGRRTLVMLMPAFGISEEENWLPWQNIVIRALNEQFPALKIVIIAFHFPLGKEKKLDWHGNDVYLLNGAMKKKLHTLRRWTRAWQLLSHIQKEQDVVGVFSFFCSECALIGHYFARRHKLEHKIWILGQDAKKDNKTVARIKPSADELVAMSDFLQNEFHTNHGILPSRVITAGIDTASFAVMPSTRDIDLLGAGSLIPLKQYDVFVDVVKMISRQLPAVNAVVCGEGSEYGRLVQQANISGIAANISFAGFQSHNETLRFMQRAKVFLHTSAYEGLGMVMLEALYAGAHVVSFVKPLNAPVANWHMVQTREEMAQKALELLCDPQIRFEPVLVYSVEETARQIAALFDIHG